MNISAWPFTKWKVEEKPMTDYPLIKQMGLEVIDAKHDYVVDANQLERALAAAPVVYQYRPGGGHADWSHQIDEDFGGAKKYCNQGRLLCVQPIQRDTAESLLREYVECMSRADAVTFHATFYNKARELLASIGESK